MGYQILLPLAVLANGLAAGGLMISVLGGVPLLMILPTQQYVPVHQFLVTRFDPFMPINLAGAFVCDVLLAILAPTGPTHVLTALAGLFVVAAMTVSLTKNVPINKWLSTIDPDNIPADFEQRDPRVRWGNWNKVRASFSVVGLLLNVIAVAISL
jgi:uncharacterized membrane protein